ncbi:MAG: non-hydrolyzing UDP-N-acetylglucosamine 2-epimerase [Fimbriimonadales bacterium]
MKKVFAVVGTRPDAIKMAPVIIEFKKHDDLETVVIASGQHKEMLQQVFNAFGITADGNFDVMKDGQSLAYLTSSILTALDEVLEREAPDIVVAQGDTTTTFVAGLASFYRRIPFAHVEAGLRTDTIDSPFPEEFNRRAVSHFTKLHFAPTSASAANLLNEGIAPEKVYVTGNTSIDAILQATSDNEEPHKDGVRTIVVTTHRRENWGDPQRAICRAVKRILDAVLCSRVVLPMHRNPIVREVLQQELGADCRVSLIEPPEYWEFARLMKSSDLILTDSGGVQEEAPALGKPVLVLRRETERPEGIEAGNAFLVGTDEEKIVAEAVSLLTDSTRYASVAQARNPYGDGLAARRIVSQLRNFLRLPAEKLPAFS